MDDFLELDGWDVIHTKAENLTRSGAAAFQRGTFDRVCIRPWRNNLYQVFWCEQKAQDSDTKDAHKSDQFWFEVLKQRQGFMTYRAPDGLADPFGHFLAWYRLHFKTRLSVYCGSTAQQ